MNKQENMNMKYIRTKGNIIPDLMNECFEKQPLSYQILGIEPIKISDNIEELCDEFVFDGGNDENPLLCDNYEELVYWFNYSKKQQYKTRNCYGAIWTEDGLIYVARMNKNGELELF